MTVVALKTQYLGHAKQAGLIASQCAGGIEMNRLTVVVDDHVDVTNIQDVVWAILARCDPERGVEIIKDTKGSRIDMAIAVAGATGGMASGFVVASSSYPALSFAGGIIALALVPLVIVRPRIKV